MIFIIFFFNCKGDLQQKGLPKWLKEELERLERKKTLELEQSLMKNSSRTVKGLGGSSRWMDEDEEDEETNGKERAEDINTDDDIKKRSHSPHSVSVSASKEF